MTGSSSARGRKRGRSPTLCEFHEAVRGALQNQIMKLETSLEDADSTYAALRHERDIAVQQKTQFERDTESVRSELRWFQQKTLAMNMRWAALKYEVEKMDPDFTVMRIGRARNPLGAEELQDILDMP